MRKLVCLLVLLLGVTISGLAQGQPDSVTNPHNGRYCLLCHIKEPRLGVDTRETVEFKGKGWDDPELCMFCHKAEDNIHPILVTPGPDALQTKIPDHLPLGTSPGLEGKIVCTTCHFLHATNSRHALLRGFAGTQQPDLFAEWQDFCRACHADNLEKRSPHDGDDRACTFCHGQKPGEGKPFSLTSSAQPLCNFCHGSLQEKHAVGMSDIDTPSLCVLCHDPHADPGDMARQKPTFVELAKNRVTLNPHYKKSLCYTCHLDQEGEKHPLRFNDVNALCNRCHASGKIIGDIHPLEKIPPTMQVPVGWPRDGDDLTCLTCHLIGHLEDDEEFALRRGGPYEDRRTFCHRCHPEDRRKGRNPHEDIDRNEGCEHCHGLRPDPKIDTAESVRLIADINLLCIRCHDVPPHPAGYRHTMLVPEERRETLSEELPIFSGRIVCGTCHNPHITGDDNSKLRSSSDLVVICFGCHSY